MDKLRFTFSILLAAVCLLMPFGAASAGTPAIANPPAGQPPPVEGIEPVQAPRLPGEAQAAHLLFLPRLVTPPYKINPAPGDYSPAEITLEVNYTGINCFYARIAPVGEWPDLRAPFEDIGGNCTGDQVTIWLDIAAEIAFDQIRIDFYDEFTRPIASRILYVGHYTFHY